MSPWKNWNFQFWSRDVFLKDCVWCFSERMFYCCASRSSKPTFHYCFFPVPYIYESRLFSWNYLSLKSLTVISVFFSLVYTFSSWSVWQQENYIVNIRQLFIPKCLLSARFICLPQIFSSNLTTTNNDFTLKVMFTSYTFLAKNCC